MDRGYKGKSTRKLERELGYNAAARPHPARKGRKECDRALYWRRNGVERLFRRGKGYRRAFRRYGKPEVMYRASRCSLVSWMLSNSGNTY